MAKCKENLASSSQGDQSVFVFREVDGAFAKDKRISIHLKGECGSEEFSPLSSSLSPSVLSPSAFFVPGSHIFGPGSVRTPCRFRGTLIRNLLSRTTFARAGRNRWHGGGIFADLRHQRFSARSHSHTSSMLPSSPPTPSPSPSLLCFSPIWP